jgi:hypothetical protein
VENNIDVASRYIFDSGFTVASSAAVVYDWGEQSLLERVIDLIILVFSSADIQSRSRLIPLPSSHHDFTKMGFYFNLSMN